MFLNLWKGLAAAFEMKILSSVFLCFCGNKNFTPRRRVSQKPQRSRRERRGPQRLEDTKHPQEIRSISTMCSMPFCMSQTLPSPKSPAHFLSFLCPYCAYVVKTAASIPFQILKLKFQIPKTFSIFLKKYPYFHKILTLFNESQTTGISHQSREGALFC